MDIHMNKKYKYTCLLCDHTTSDRNNTTPIYSMVDHINTKHVKGVTIVSIAEWCTREEDNG